MSDPSAPVAHARRAQPNGWWGTLLLVATEASLFGTLLGTYYYFRFSSPAWPPPGIEPPDPVLPLVLTGVLVLTQAPVLLAARSLRDGIASRARALLLAAVLVQAGYLAVQVVLFRSDLNTFSPQDTAYGSIYFTLLAVHHVHVVIGMVLEAGLALRLVHGVNTYREVTGRVVSLYWWFVNAMAILVVLTQVSPAL